MESFILPALPSDWPVGTTCKEYANISAPEPVQLEPTGRWYEAYASRKRLGRTLSQDEAEMADLDEGANEEVNSESEDEGEVDVGPTDPTKIKELDLYKLMGLAHLRYKATDEQIRRAYRKQVLRHHPDKKGKKADGGDDDDMFKCIHIANDILSDPTTRRSFDSVDPTFDDTIPPTIKKGPLDAETFFATFGPVFESNSRFSEIQPVPSLGTLESTREEVDDFYQFWYSFKSWREFSYEEEEDKAENREEKRWQDKEKKSERKQKKLEETQRIKKLVDNAFKGDPRIQMFKEKEKAERLAKKLSKEAAQLAEKEREAKAKEAERLARERELEKAREIAVEEKRLKEEQKRIIKNHRKKLRQLCADNHYFEDQSNSLKMAETMALVGMMIEKLTLDELVDINSNFSKDTLDKNMRKHMVKTADNSKKTHSVNATNEKGRIWTDLEEELLVKAVKTFPAGTRQRWETMANYINVRSTESQLTGDEVLKKVKERQHVDKTLQQKHNEEAFTKFEKKNKHLEGEVPSQGGLSVRYSQELQDQAKAAAAPAAKAPAPANDWTVEQQKALESALRTTKEIKEGKWDKIAELVPGKTKKECMVRYKQLADAVKAKKAQKA